MTELNKKTILIATGLYPPDIGGPAYYAKSLEENFRASGFTTKVRFYNLEKKIPTGFRHLYYFFRVCLTMPFVDYVIVLDTFSVGWPVIIAARLFNKKAIIRTGGDFLWESYANRTKEFIILSSFYRQARHFNWKEKVIFKLTKWELRYCWKVVFSTDWQRNIWLSAYNLNKDKTAIIENYFGPKKEISLVSANPPRRYLWAGRDIFIKNLDLLRKGFKRAQATDSSLELEIVTDLSQTELFDRIESCDVVIVPSLSEISPNFILEAIMRGKPFILTKETGYRDKLKDCGLFVDPLKIDEIAEAVLTMAKSEIYNSYCQAIRRFDFTHSYQKISQEFINLFTQE